MSLVFDNVRVDTPGRDTRCWLDDPKLPKIGASSRDDGFPRNPQDVQAIVLHTTKGKLGKLRATRPPASTKAESLARYQDRSERDVSWHFSIDVDETIVQSADPGEWACWHAGQVNGRTIGIEIVQLDDLAVYDVQLAALTWLVDTLCARYGVPRTVPVGSDCKPWGKIIPELMKSPEGDSGRSWRGVYGHRNCSRKRGLGDPGDHPFAALLRSGYQTVVVDSRGRRSGPGAPICGAPIRVVLPVPTPPPSVRAWPALPEWIDPDQEHTDTRDISTPPGVWAHEAMGHLLALGVPRQRAVEVVAHCAVECSWGRRAVADNCGGVKLSETDNRREERRSGDGLPWWRWEGHVDRGDDAVVYYRAFTDAPAFWAFWLSRYVPRSADVAERERYIATGAAFWSGRGDWFVELLRAGYRGRTRQKEIDEARDPSKHPSVVTHRKAIGDVEAYLRAP